MSRRGVLSSVALIALGAAMPFSALGQIAPLLNQTPPRHFLTETEWRTLTAIVDRIIPKDQWPSASEAGVVDFIDFQLATTWGAGSGLFLKGPHANGSASQGYQLAHTPAELYRMALSDPALAKFGTLDPAAQDVFLTRLEKNEQALGGIPGGVFFTQLRQSVLEGYFSDPIHNGNHDMAGWRMIGFPGAHAYYLTEIDRFEFDYARPPSGVGYRPREARSGILPPTSVPARR